MEYYIKKGGHVDLKRIYPMLEFDFQSYELMPRVVLHKALWDKAAELLLLKDEDGLEHGYAVVLTSCPFGYVLCAWLGVYPTDRQSGLAGELMRLLIEYYADKQGIIIEVTERPDSEWLRKFYEKYAFEDTGIPYALSGRPYTLMLRPLRSDKKLTLPLAKVVMEDLYGSAIGAYLTGRFIEVGEKL